MAGDYEVILIRAPSNIKASDLEKLDVKSLGKSDSWEIEINETTYSLSVPLMRDASDLVSLSLLAPEGLSVSEKAASNLHKHVIDRYYSLTPTFSVPTEKDFIKAAKEALKVPVTTPCQPEDLKPRWVPFGVAPSEVPTVEKSPARKEASSPEKSKKRKSEGTPKEKKTTKKSKA